MTHPFALASGFIDPEIARWQELAEKALRGAPFDRLIGQTYDGVPVRPLYTPADAPNPAERTGLAGQAPFIRGAKAVRDAFLAWDIRQTILTPDPQAANQTALYDLERGVSSLEFVIDPSGNCGVAASRVTDFQALIKGILLPLATVALDAPGDPLGAARALADAVAPGDRATAKLAFNLDPMAARMNGQTGCSLGAAAGFAAQTVSLFPNTTALRADARPVHEGGGSEAQELAVLIASGIAHVRAGEAVGLSPAAVNSTLLFTLSAGPDVVLEIAKQRAARRLWARVLDACGVAAPMCLQAVTSARMQTKRDPWTNIVRATCACFGAAAGGADVITVLPFTSAVGLADENARRIARNTQLILQEESHLGRVTDPAGGAWAMEALAEDLAQAAWPLVREIERAGGLPSALDQGLVQGWAAETRSARTRDIAKRKTQLIGINIYANLDEIVPATPSISATTPPATPLAGAIPPMRLAQDFEALRDRADSLSPKIFLATLGSLAKFSARSGFARNAFEAGGIRALGADIAYPDQAALITAFKASGAHLVCLCGDDATYEADATEAAAALKAAGAEQIWLAGKFQTANIDRNLFAGSDILAELTHAITLLEEPA